jgi:SAM-dependent methyltransferase
MITTQSAINTPTLRQITKHHRRLGLKSLVKGLPYERCAELPWVIDYLKPRFAETLDYLDIGTGESALPTYLLTQSRWNITCIDKCSWVHSQTQYLDTLANSADDKKRFHVLEADLLTNPPAAESFDVITCISVIEHFEGATDTAAIKECARLLRPGGTLVLTTLMNDRYFAEFYVHRSVYGTKNQDAPTYYQRHYDIKNLESRLIAPSGLTVKQRVFFGDYDFQCFEKVMQQPKPVRALYAWNTPSLAKRYLSYRDYPVSRKEMRTNTASGVILVFEKPLQ